MQPPIRECSSSAPESEKKFSGKSSPACQRQEQPTPDCDRWFRDNTWAGKKSAQAYRPQSLSTEAALPSDFPTASIRLREVRRKDRPRRVVVARRQPRDAVFRQDRSCAQSRPAASGCGPKKMSAAHRRNLCTGQRIAVTSSVTRPRRIAAACRRICSILQFLAHGEESAHEAGGF